MASKMKRVFCIGCGVIRMAEPDSIMSEIEGKKTTIEPCPVCSCPYVELESVEKKKDEENGN